MLILLTQVLFYLQVKQAALSRYHVVKQQIKDETTSAPASFPAVLGDIRCDVTCKACRKNLPKTIALGSNPLLVTLITRTGLGIRLLLRLMYIMNISFFAPQS